MNRGQPRPCLATDRENHEIAIANQSGGSVVQNERERSTSSTSSSEQQSTSSKSSTSSRNSSSSSTSAKHHSTSSAEKPSHKKSTTAPDQTSNIKCNNNQEFSFGTCVREPRVSLLEDFGGWRFSSLMELSDEGVCARSCGRVASVAVFYFIIIICRFGFHKIGNSVQQHREP